MRLRPKKGGGDAPRRAGNRKTPISVARAEVSSLPPPRPKATVAPRVALIRKSFEVRGHTARQLKEEPARADGAEGPRLEGKSGSMTSAPHSIGNPTEGATSTAPISTSFEGLRRQARKRQLGPFRVKTDGFCR